MKHGISREEWESRFAIRFLERADVDDPDIIISELESWPLEDTPYADANWEEVTPEEAADEQLQYWSD